MKSSMLSDCSKNSKWNYHVTQQHHFWVYTHNNWKWAFEEIFVFKSSVIHYNLNMEATQVSISVDEWISKMLYILYNGILFNLNKNGKPITCYNIHDCWRHFVVQSLSHVWFFATPWTVACLAPLSMGFSRQECWSELPCPPLGHLPDPGIDPMSLTSPSLADRSFTTNTTWEGSFFLRVL